VKQKKFVTMAAPLLKEPPLEERVARIESHVEHIQCDERDIKVEIRELRKDLQRREEKLAATIGGVMTGKRTSGGVRLPRRAFRRWSAEQI
jgi:hypothetical protein